MQNAEKIVQVACVFFLTETSNAENKATVYFACKNSHVVIISFLLTVHYIMCDYQVIRLTPPTLPSLLSILKDFPVRQYAQAACETEGTSIILCVCYFLEHSSDPSMKSPYELCLFVFVALRPMSTAMVIAGRSVHLTTLFPGQA